MVKANPNPKPKQLTRAGRTHQSVSFSLPFAIIDALNEKCGNNKGERSRYVVDILSKALGI
jgi:hypothetical protein